MAGQPNQQPLPTGPDAAIQPAPTPGGMQFAGPAQGADAGQSGPAQVPSAPPSAPGLDGDTARTAALLTALGGLGLNIAGAATRTGAVGNQAIEESQKLQKQGYYADKQQGAQQAADQQAKEDAEIGKTLAAQLPKISDPTARATVQSFIDAGRPKDALSQLNLLMGRQDAMDRHNDAMDRINDKLNNQQGTLDKNDAANLAKEYSTSIAELKKGGLKDEAANALKIEQYLRSLPDPSQFNIGNFKLAHPDLKLDKNSSAQLQQVVNQQLSSQKQGGFMGFGSHLPQGTTSDQAFANIAQKMVSPQAINDHLAAQQKLSGLQDSLKLVNFVKANLGNKDPKVQQKVQTTLDMLRSTSGE